MKKEILLIAVLILISAGCKPKIDAPETSMGEVNASQYIAIGTDGTAGFTDDALYQHGQSYSYATILSDQFNMISEATFNQPLLNDGGQIGINLDGNSQLVLGYKTDCNNETSLSPVRYSLSGNLNELSTSVYSTQGPFNNLGVSGLSALEVNTAGYGNPANGADNYNPFYYRMASDPVNSSILSDALSGNPTFYSILLGDQDIMAYASSGGSSNPIPPSNGAAGFGFDGSLNEVVNAMSGTGAKGVIGNVANVLQYPFFTTIPYNGLTLDAENAETINLVYNPLGIYFEQGDNPFTIDDPNEPFGVRKMVEGELILLSIPLDSVKCYGMGSIIPIPDQYILTLDEIQEINLKTQEYNAAIMTLVQTYDLAHANVNTLIDNLSSGIVYNGITMNTNFVTGGAFSLDGKNLNPIGQAMLANIFIQSINATFNAAIPFADVSKFPGVKFP